MSDIGKYKRFMPIAKQFAQMSKDPSSQVGALILGPAFEVRSSGWNGAPRGCKADEDERFQRRPEKYLWAAHAEANAIVNAARVGTPLNGCTMLITLPPCMECAKLIVQSGIAKVIYQEGSAEFYVRWADSVAASHALFEECGVEVLTLPREQV